MIWYILTQIGGTRPDALLCGRWDKQLIRVGDRRIFLDVNPDFYWVVEDSLDKQKHHIS